MVTMISNSVRRTHWLFVAIETYTYRHGFWALLSSSENVWVCLICFIMGRLRQVVRKHDRGQNFLEFFATFCCEIPYISGHHCITQVSLSNLDVIMVALKSLMSNRTWHSLLCLDVTWLVVLIWFYWLFYYFLFFIFFDTMIVCPAFFCVL